VMKVCSFPSLREICHDAKSRGKLLEIGGVLANKWMAAVFYSRQGEVEPPVPDFRRRAYPRIRSKLIRGRRGMP
jgi:hypothetical protein